MANAFLLKPLVPAGISLGAAPAALDFTSGALPSGVSIQRGAAPYSYRDASGGVTTGSAANTARFDYDPPVNNSPVCRGLMLEPASTNTLSPSAQFDNAAWQKFGSPTVQADFGVAPDGTQTADRLVCPNGSGYNSTLRMTNIPSTGTAQRVAIIYMRSSGGGNQTVDINLTEPGVLDHHQEFVVGPTWTKCVVPVTFSNANSISTFSIANGAAGAALDVLIWGAGVYPGTAASYIPTTNASASRPTETLVLPAPGSSGTQDVLLTYSDGTTETRTGAVAGGYVTLQASNTPRVIAKAQLVATASSVQVGALNNLLNDYAGVIATLSGGSQAIIIVDLGADTAIDTAMLFGVELFPTNGGLSVDYATSAQGPFTGAYATDATGVAYAGSAPLSSGKGVSLWMLTAPVTARYVRFTFAAVGASIRLSRLVVGQRFQPTRNFSYGASFGVRDLGSLDFSRRGVLLRARGAKLRTAALTFSYLQKDEAEAAMKPLLEYLGNTECVALVADPTADPQRQNRCYFGPLVGDVSQAWKTARSWETKLNLVSLF